jgi:pyruvate/2-oxoglutarate dehydrogenase complex dihydrolipoamide dehydrogenase (E3) component
MKALIDARTDRILGFTMFGPEAAAGNSFSAKAVGHMAPTAILFSQSVAVPRNVVGPPRNTLETVVP